MEIILVRHAIAEDRLEFANKGLSDIERPITEEGSKRFKKMAEVLHKVEDNVPLILASPLLRAQQTADIINELFPKAERMAASYLSPESSPQEALNNISELKEKKLLLVGHEPHLSALASWVLCKQLNGFIKMKKGGILKIQFPHGFEPGKGLLAWYLTPGTVMKL